MKLLQFLVSVNNQVILYLIILLATIDYQGILDYTIKAILGSAIWFGFKVLADRYSLKYKKAIGFESKVEENKGIDK